MNKASQKKPLHQKPTILTLSYGKYPSCLMMLNSLPRNVQKYSCRLLRLIPSTDLVVKAEERIMRKAKVRVREAEVMRTEKSRPEKIRRTARRVRE